MHFGFAAAFALSLCSLPTLASAAIDCSPVKPSGGADTTIEDNLKGHAQLILKSLGSGEIENGYKQTEADTLNKYPNADQLLLWRAYIYIACSLLQSSTQWTDDQKFEKLLQLISLYHKPPPTDVLQNGEPTNSFTGQSDGFAVQARCRRAANAVVCTATIVNQDANRQVMVWVAQTKLFNAASQGFPASEATVAGNRGNSNSIIRAKLLQGRAAEAVFQFEGVPASDVEFAELDIRIGSGSELPVTLECSGNLTIK